MTISNDAVDAVMSWLDYDAMRGVPQEVIDKAVSDCDQIMQLNTSKQGDDNE